MRLLPVFQVNQEQAVAYGSNGKQFVFPNTSAVYPDRDMIGIFQLEARSYGITFQCIYLPAGLPDNIFIIGNPKHEFSFSIQEDCILAEAFQTVAA